MWKKGWEKGEEGWEKGEEGWEKGEEGWEKGGEEREKGEDYPLSPPRISKKNRQHNGKKEGLKDKQRSTKHTRKTKDRVTRTPLKSGGELRCSGRVGSSCSTSGTRRVNLVNVL